MEHKGRRKDEDMDSIIFDHGSNLSSIFSIILQKYKIQYFTSVLYITLLLQ